MGLANQLNRTGHYLPIIAYEVPFTAPSDGSETDTGFDLPDTGLVVDCLPIIDTAEATGGTKTIDAGLLASESGGDADGFLDGVSVAATGIIEPVLDQGAETYGAFLRRAVARERILRFALGLASVADGNLVTGFVMPFAGSIDSWLARCTEKVTTASKLSTLNLELATVDVGTTPSTCSLTTAALAAIGDEVAGTAVSGANTFVKGAALDIEAASTTAFAEGAVDLEIRCTQSDDYVKGVLDLASVTAKSVSITAGSADFAELVGRLIFFIAPDPNSWKTIES